MQQKLYQIKQYIKHLRNAKSRFGHGVHSPFVYELIEQVFNHQGRYYAFHKIEQVREQLLKEKKIITIEDFGAGSSQTKSNKRAISDIARSALLQKEHAQLLFRLVNRFRPSTILELGTSLGTTTAYLALARKTAQVYTFEGSPEISRIAKRNLDYIKLKNVQLITGPFDKKLPLALDRIETVDFAFIDGNHTYEATIRYFEMLLNKSSERSVFVFDDIYWSEGMTKAWKQIIKHPKVTISIDLFRMGIIFFRPESTKEDFIIRF